MCSSLKHNVQSQYTPPHSVVRVIVTLAAQFMDTLASFPGSSAWVERKEPGTHCLRMLSSPRISGNLEISVKSAPLH